jgi:hypothetical protein
MKSSVRRLVQYKSNNLHLWRIASNLAISRHVSLKTSSLQVLESNTTVSFILVSYIVLCLIQMININSNFTAIVLIGATSGYVSLTDVDHDDYVFRLILVTVKPFQIFWILHVLGIRNVWHQPINEKRASYQWSQYMKQFSCSAEKSLQVEWTGFDFMGLM